MELSGSSLPQFSLCPSFLFPQGWARPSGTYFIHPPLHTCCSSTQFPTLDTYSSYKPISPSTLCQFVVSSLVVTLRAPWSCDRDKRIFLTPARASTVCLTCFVFPSSSPAICLPSALSSPGTCSTPLCPNLSAHILVNRLLIYSPFVWVELTMCLVVCSSPLLWKGGGAFQDGLLWMQGRTWRRPPWRCQREGCLSFEIVYVCPPPHRLCWLAKVYITPTYWLIWKFRYVELSRCLFKLTSV